MDLLVKLYDQDFRTGSLDDREIKVRKPIGPERDTVLDWVESRFSRPWRSEAAAAFTNNPVSIYVAVEGNKLVGFGCYNATAKGYFGPLGTAESSRKLGVGKSLLFRCLSAMSEEGYGYAIIPTTQPEYYRKYLDVFDVPGSDPGIYRNMLEADD